MNFHLIVNPKCGKGNGRDIRDQVLPVLENSNRNINVIETTHPGHAGELANQLDLNDIDGLYVIGGDGTMHEVVNGLLSRTDNQTVPIGLIPGGSGNSFMYDLDKLDPVHAAEMIIRGKARPIDALEVTNNHVRSYSFNIVGWGLVADISIESEKARWIGPSRYTLFSILQVIKLIKRKAILILDDEHIEDEFIFVIACNTIHTGKGMKMAPRAKLDDGLVDVIFVRDATRRQLLSLLPTIFEGSHVNNPKLEYRQVSKVSIITSEQYPTVIDGEVKHSTPLELTVIKHAFEVFGE